MTSSATCLDEARHAALAARVSCDPGTRPSLQVRTAFEDELLGLLPSTAPADIAATITAARAAQRSWGAMPARFRTTVFTRAAKLILTYADHVMDLVQAETGKSRGSAFEEVAETARGFRQLPRYAVRQLRPLRHRGAVPLLTVAREVRRPKGVVGIISSWDRPFASPAMDALVALMAGNAVIVKPDSLTPYSALLLGEFLDAARLPKDLFQVVVGPGAVLGPALVEAVDHVLFTGSPRTARRLAGHCADRMIGFTAEVSGKNVMLVLADADLDRAVAGVVRSCLSNAGQSGTGAERIIVSRECYPEFCSRVVAAVRSLRLGPGSGWEIDLGSLSCRDQLERVQRHVADAVAKGASVLVGGSPRPELGPWFFEPTVLADVCPDMLVSTERTAGPVIAITPVPDDQQAIALANEGSSGLHASVYSARHWRGVSALLETGSVSINEGSAATRGSLTAPIGGRKASGIGRRRGRDGVLQLTEAQTIARQRWRGLNPPEGMPTRDFADRVTTGIRWLNRLD